MNIPNTASAAWVIPGLPRIESKRITADDIIRIVARYYNMPICRLKMKKRTRVIVRARQVATYLICIHTDLTVVKIATIFEQDHATVIFSRESVRDQLSLANDNTYQIDVREIESLLKLRRDG